jgi:hypothetical protein
MLSGSRDPGVIRAPPDPRLGRDSKKFEPAPTHYRRRGMGGNFALRFPLPPRTLRLL